MTENIADLPLVWIFDSDRSPLAGCVEAFEDWADAVYYAADAGDPDWDSPPDAVFFSAEVKGGAAGDVFGGLSRNAAGVPLLAVARLRSLAQAVSYWRAGAADYLSLPLEEEDVRERLQAALVRAEQLAMQGMMVELEPVDLDPGEISLRVARTDATDASGEIDDEVDDILAHLSGDIGEAARESHGEPAAEEEEPEAVDGLPIPNLWEELPCGLLVFDSNANLVFSNSLGLDLFGYGSLAELQEALETGRSRFAAHGANLRPMADNQWPHVLAARTRTARSAVLSIEKPDRRRIWLRVDCLPHLSDGKISRLSMTLVNLTGELPALNITPAAATAPIAGKREKTKKGRRKK